MRIAYRVSPELLQILKEPFGNLLRGTSPKTMKQLRTIVAAEKPTLIISVGDKVSKNLHKHQITPQLSITDNKSLRRTVKPAVFESKKTVRVHNPPGTITDDAEAAIRDALKSNEHIHIVVEGEEDLLTPIAVLYAPENAIVVYGQPYQGLVVVRVTAEKKERVKELLDAMSRSGKDK
jgi:GTP-dependent dephospho-CoA kinase